MRCLTSASHVCLAQVASLVGADPKEIIFTSGATESNNLAIKGVAGFYRDKKKHLITTQTERARPAGCAMPLVAAPQTWRAVSQHSVLCHTHGRQSPRVIPAQCIVWVAWALHG